MSDIKPEIDLAVLRRELSQATGLNVAETAAVALGASSRATPWRLDCETADGARSFVMRFGESVSRREVFALQAMEAHPFPTPRVILWQEDSAVAAGPLLVTELIDGEPLLPPMVAGHDWAIELYIETACSLQAITGLDDELVAQLGSAESALEVVEAAHDRLPGGDPLHEAAYVRLKETAPQIPEVAFSNGDLWPENLLIREKQLVGVIDWQHAGWSDPLFEFLLPFFLVPELRGRGIEEEYCRRKGFDPTMLHWYHGVEFFDSLAWVLKTGQPYEMHTVESLTRDLQEWLAS